MFTCFVKSASNVPSKVLGGLGPMYRPAAQHTDGEVRTYLGWGRFWGRSGLHVATSGRTPKTFLASISVESLAWRATESAVAERSAMDIVRARFMIVARGWFRT